MRNTKNLQNGNIKTQQTDKLSNTQTSKQTDKQTHRHNDWGYKGGSTCLQDPINRLSPLAQVLSVTVYDAILLQAIS